MKENVKWYKNTYNSLIEKGKLRQQEKDFNPKLTCNSDVVYERHHIIPKCCGGENLEDNLVYLTTREHAIAHLLLSRIYEENDKLALTVFLMMGNKRISSTRLYSEFRERAIKMNLGEGNPMFGKHITEEHKRILSEVNKYKRSEETKRKMANSQRGKKASKETKEKLSKAHLGLKIHSEEHKEDLRKKWIGKNNPNYHKDMRGANNPASKKVIDSEGRIFTSLTECANHYGVSKQTMSNWVRSNNKGYRFL